MKEDNLYKLFKHQYLPVTSLFLRKLNYPEILLIIGSSGSRFGQTDEYRVAAFITCIGPQALTIHNGLLFQSKDEKKNLAKILELWESYCLGKTNIIYERYRFNNRNQDAGESIDTYASSLRSLSDTCNFGTLKEEMIRDRIVCGVRDGSLRKKLTSTYV